MAEWDIDARNPGEVLACCGIAHLAWRQQRSAETGFYSHLGRWYFTAPDGVLETIGPPTLTMADAGLHNAVLHLAGIVLDWWQPWGLNPECKFWAGQQSESTVHRNLVAGAGEGDVGDWQTCTAPTTGRLNFDTRGTWNALSLGWSLNEHPHMQMLCRPWLELLASIGLQGFRLRGGKRDGFCYHLWYPAPFPSAIAAFQGHGPGLYALAGFRTRTGKSGSNTILLNASALD